MGSSWNTAGRKVDVEYIVKLRNGRRKEEVSSGVKTATAYERQLRLRLRISCLMRMWPSEGSSEIYKVKPLLSQGRGVAAPRLHLHLHDRLPACTTLGLLASLYSIEDEAQSDDVVDSFGCIYPRSPSSILPLSVEE